MVIASLNINGLTTKVDELREIVSEKGIHITGINETKISPSLPDDIISIDGILLLGKIEMNLGVVLQFTFTAPSIMR